MTLLRQRYVGALLLVKTLYEFNMHEGTVKGGIYGGTNAAAAIQKNANVNIYGGQVGTDTSHTGNVYGGGNAADVTGKTNVTIGRSPTTTP